MSLARLLKIHIRFVLTILFLLTSSQTVYSQYSIEKSLDTENATEEDVEYLEEIQNLKDNPIDINSATQNQLSRLPGLPLPVIESILHYRKTNGDFKKKTDIKNVPGMSNEIYRKIRSFFIVKKKRTGKSHFAGRTRFRYASRDSNPEDYDSFYSLYQRVQLDYRQWLHMGFLTEKDPGETDFDDLRLWYLNIDTPYLPVRGIVGHYKMRFGQGLLFSSQGGMFKGGQVVTGTKKRGSAVRPYTSTNEIAPFYGLALNGKVWQLSYYFFLSECKLDATIDSSLTVQSIYETGLHRNDNENAKKDQLTETVYGFHSRYHLDGMSSFGLTYYQSQYTKQINPRLESRTYYRFRGDALSGRSFDVDLYFQRLNIYGEAAQSVNHGNGWVFGASFDFKQLEFAALIRDYDPNFFTFHSYGFADSKGNDENERGQFLGIRWRLPGKIKLWAYFDFFRHPFRGYSYPVPYEGSEYYTQLEVPVSQTLFCTFRVRSKKRLYSTRQNYRAQLDWEPSKTYRLRFRYEQVRVTNDIGMVLYGDIRLRSISRFQLYARLAFYDTDSSETAVYTFENDLPGVLKNSQLSGQGRRWYLLGKYEIRKKTALSLKLSQKTQLQPIIDSLNVSSLARSTITEWGCQLDLVF